MFKFLSGIRRKFSTAHLEIRRARLVQDEHGLVIAYEQIAPPLAGCERAVRASVIKNAGLQELTADALQEVALARRMHRQRHAKPSSRDI